MFNLLSKINMSIIGSKLASYSPLMLNTLTTAEVTGATSAGLALVLDFIIDLIVKAVYAICAFALNIIDFFQFVINKIIGLGEEYVVFDTTNPLIKFLLNDTVWKVFTYVSVIAIILLVVFTIYAIIRSEYQFATGSSGDNSKGRIFGRAIRSLFIMFIFPFVLFGTIILTNSVLHGFNRVFTEATGEGTVSLGGQVFASATYNANKYRNFAKADLRVPIFIDFDDPIQNGTAPGYTPEELAEIYRTYNENGGADLHHMYAYGEFDSWKNTIIHKNNKIYNTVDYSEYESFIATPDQYYLMADFTDYAVKTGLTYTYKSVKDDDINWKYVDEVVFEKETLTLSITYRDANDITSGDSYVMEVTPSSTDISTPIQDAIKTISTMLAIGDYSDDTFNILSRNEDFVNYIEWDTRKVKLRLSEGCVLTNPDTWTVSDSILLYEWSRFDYNNTIDSYLTIDELKTKGVELNAQMLSKRTYVTTISEYVTTEKIDVVYINGNYYRIVEAKDRNDKNNLDEHGFPFYYIVGYDVDKNTTIDESDVLYDRNTLVQMSAFVNGYINNKTYEIYTSGISEISYNGKISYVLNNEFHTTNTTADHTNDWSVFGYNGVRRLEIRDGKYYFVGSNVTVSENEVVTIVDGSNYYYYAADVVEKTLSTIEKGYYIASNGKYVLVDDAVLIRSTNASDCKNIYYCSDESFQDIIEVKVNGTFEFVDPETGDKNYTFYDDLLSDNIKTVSWPEKLISDLQVIYKDINLELLISNGTWLTKLSELSSNYFASNTGINAHAAFSSSLIHPLGMIMSELLLGIVEDANPYFDYGDLVFSSAYDQETINGLVLALLGEDKYYQAKQELSSFVEIFNGYFTQMLDEIAYTENFDLKVGEEASVQLFTYKAYLSSVLLSDDCAKYFADLALKVIGSNDFISGITDSRGNYLEKDTTYSVAGQPLSSIMSDILTYFENPTANEIFQILAAYLNYQIDQVDEAGNVVKDGSGNPVKVPFDETSLKLYNLRKNIILSYITNTDGLSTKVGQLKTTQNLLDFNDDLTDSALRQNAEANADFTNITEEEYFETFMNELKDFASKQEENWQSSEEFRYLANFEFKNISNLLTKEKVYGSAATAANWDELKSYLNDMKSLLEHAQELYARSSAFTLGASGYYKFYNLFMKIANQCEQVTEFVSTQDLSDALSRYYIGYSVKIVFDEQVNKSSFTISVRNKQYKVGDAFIKAKLAEYILGADYLKSKGYDVVFVDDNYKGVVQFKQETGSDNLVIESSWKNLRKFLEEFGQICVDLYSTTNYGALMVNSVDELKFDDNPYLADMVVEYILRQNLLDAKTLLRLGLVNGTNVTGGRPVTINGISAYMAENGFIWYTKDSSGELIKTGLRDANKTKTLDRLQGIMEYLLNTTEISGNIGYVNYRTMSLKELRIACLDFLSNYKQPEGIDPEKAQQAYLTLFYLVNTNWTTTTAVDYKNWRVNEGTTNSFAVITGIDDNSQSIGTLLRLAGIESRPIEDLVGLEYTIDFNYHGVDEQYGDVFILCTYNEQSRQYLPILSVPKGSLTSDIDNDLDEFRDEDGYLPNGDDDYLVIMRTKAVDYNLLRAEGNDKGLKSAYPIVARGAIDDNGFPTAIKIVNGNVHFYREDTYLINTSEAGIKEYFVSAEQVMSGGNPISWAVNGITKLFTGKTLAEHIVSSVPRIKLESYVGYAIGVQTSTIDVVDNADCHLDYNFAGFLTDSIPMDVLYDLNEINLIILISAISILFGLLFRAFWGLIARMFNLTLYFVMGPLMISTIVQKTESKNGESSVAYDTWKESIINELFSVFSYVFAINLYFVLANMVQSFELFTNVDMFKEIPLFSNVTVEFANEISRVVFLLGLGSIFGSLPKIFASILGVEDIFNQGDSTFAAVKNNVNTVRDAVSGQEIVDKFDKAMEPLDGIKRKATAAAAFAVAAVYTKDVKASRAAAKALDKKMKEQQDARKEKRDTREWQRDENRDAMFGTDEGDGYSRRLRNNELAEQQVDKRDKKTGAVKKYNKKGHTKAKEQHEANKQKNAKKK